MAEKIVAEGVEAALGERLHAARPLSGGCIGEVYRVELSDGSAVVAKVDRAGEAHLPREAYMLRYLRERTDLPVPEVYHSSETLLLMEFMEGGNDLSGAEVPAAELLAGLHAVSAGAYGLEEDTLIGNLPQPNPWTGSWVEFFREQRLLYMARVAHEAGRLPAELHRRVEGFAGSLGDFIGEPERPSLVHGDVWSGNILAKGTRVTAFLDPAIYHADPEVELAYIALFGTFGGRFFEIYDEYRGIREGFFEERRYVYSLYPLLTHVYYFGGHYVRLVESTLRKLGC